MNDLFDSFKQWARPHQPRAHARRSDPHTSHEAAASVEELRASQQRLFNLLARIGPATDEEIFAALRVARIAMSPSGARSRRSELVAQGFVVDTGMRKFTVAGRRTIVWRVHQPQQCHDMEK